MRIWVNGRNIKNELGGIGYVGAGIFWETFFCVLLRLLCFHLYKITVAMLDAIRKSPLIPLFYHADPAYAQQAVQACYDGGLRLFEFTNRGPKAFEVFSIVSEYVRVHCPGLLLGIGTIYTAEDAHRFAAAGADFIIQPVTTVDVAEACRALGKPWIPGATTPTEIWNAWQLGATCVKIFPGNVLGSGFVKALRGPMPQVPLMATGGVEPTEASLREWFGAGVQAVGLGSQLFKQDFTGNFAALRDTVAGLLEFVRGETGMN